MIPITVDARAAGVLAFLRNAEKRMGVTISKAINATALRVQTAQKLNAGSRLTLRKPDFIRREIAIIKPFATPTSLMAQISVGQKERLLLAQLETGGLKRPATPGARRVGVPITGSSARRTFGGQVPAELQLRRLKLRRTRPGTGFTKSGRRRRSKASRGGQVLYGPERTFRVPGVKGVLRRTGPGKRDVELIHSFDPHVPLQPRLGWLAVAHREVRLHFAPALAAEVRKTLDYSARIR